ncbi:MAG: HAD family hydrolase [Proteobacteria bacterium]|nr:HAD family hydrolase [Pseudomonadota bacterium]
MNKTLVSKYIVSLAPIPSQLLRSGKLDAKIGCVLFDIYGTLFVSGAGDIAHSRQQALETGKLDQLLHTYQIGQTSRSILDRFFEQIEKEHRILVAKGVNHPEVEIDRIWAAVLDDGDMDRIRAFAVEFEMLTNPVYPMPHLREMLSVCRASRVKMGIVSNAQFYTPFLFEWFLDSSLEELGIEAELTLFSYQFGCAKPSGVLFRTAAERLMNLGIAPDSVLFLGNDMRTDMLPARKVGFKTALFAGDTRSLRLRKDDPECRTLSPDLVVTSLDQLIGHIRRI